MQKSSSFRVLLLLAVTSVSAGFSPPSPLGAQTWTGAAAPAKPGEIQIRNGPIPMRVLMQSPADTATELQVICLFQSEASNTLHGSLIEIDEKLKGLLSQLHSPALFRGELGETILVTPPVGSLDAKKLLMVGLGDSQTFTSQRMELVGSILYQEANRLRIAHPFFAPTVLDGGVTKCGTGQVSEQVIFGFLRAMHAERMLEQAGGAPGQTVQDLAYLAGPAHAADTQQGIERAIAPTG